MPRCSPHAGRLWPISRPQVTPTSRSRDMVSALVHNSAPPSTKPQEVSHDRSHHQPPQLSPSPRARHRGSSATSRLATRVRDRPAARATAPHGAGDGRDLFLPRRICRGVVGVDLIMLDRRQADTRAPAVDQPVMPGTRRSSTRIVACVVQAPGHVDASSPGVAGSTNLPVVAPPSAGKGLRVSECA